MQLDVLTTLLKDTFMHLPTLQIIYIQGSAAMLPSSGGQLVTQYLPCYVP